MSGVAPEEVEKSADHLDQAATLTTMLTQHGVNEIRARLYPEQHHAFDGAHCVDCGIAIVEERLAAGRVRCTDCQSLKEDDIRRRRG